MAIIQQSASDKLTQLIQQQSQSGHPFQVLVHDSLMPWAVDFGHQHGMRVASFFTQAYSVSTIHYAFLLWFIIILVPVLGLCYQRRKSVYARLPPGPPGWPLFGNMFDLGEMPHRTLAGLAKDYGPVVWLKFGTINSIVILNATAAADLFKNHDHNFAERTITQTMKSHDYDKSSLALAPYGSYWRVLRRICTVEMLVSKRLNETVPIRQRCINNLMGWIEMEAGNEIEVAKFVFLSSFNMLGNLMLSRDLVDPQSKAASEFFDAMMGLMEWSGHANISDVFPCLRWFDLQGLRKNMDRDIGKALAIAAEFFKERAKAKENQQTEGNKTNDFLDVLLEFRGKGKDEPAQLKERDINIFILEIFLAGSETTSSTTEWAMTELLRSPGKMAKVKAELANVIGKNRRFEESDIDKLPYLQAVMKETLRLHPPIPLLVPRKAMKDTEFMGYNIPKNTQVFVNAWTIGRDPECWDDPLSFEPERFLGSKIDYKGQHYGFIPFGAGRRMCAGVPLAHKMLHIILGSLLHEFDWHYESPETMDTRDRIGITVRKFVPLKAIPTKPGL